MRHFRGGIAVAALLLSVAAVSADTVVDKNGTEYADARDALAADARAVAAMREVLATTAYDAQNWLRLVLMEAVVMHATRRGDAHSLRHLEGLDPEHYLRRRRPEPSVARELRQMYDSAPLMIELFLKELDTYEWSSAEAAAMERHALADGLLLAVGRSRHPSAVFFLAEVVAGGCECCASCATAILALGDTGAPEAVPVLLEAAAAAADGGDTERQAIALNALGRIRRAETWPHIKAALSHADPIVRTAAVRSAGAFGSQRLWGDTSARGTQIQEEVGTALLGVYVAEEDERVVAAALASIGRVATPALRDEVEAELIDADPGASPGGSRSRARERMQSMVALLDRKLRHRGGDLKR